MLTYREFINEKKGYDCPYYDGYYIKITSRKTIEEIEEIVNGITGRWIVNDNKWKLIDPNKKIYRVYTKKPIHHQSIINLFNNGEGRSYDLKYKFLKNGDCVNNKITSDEDKEKLKELFSEEYPTRKHHISNRLMHIIFKSGKYYEDKIKNKIKDLLDKDAITKNVVRRSMFGTQHLTDESLKMFFTFLIEIMQEAVENRDLDFNMEYVRSLIAGSKYNLFD